MATDTKLIKILMLGGNYSGKTCLLHRYVEGTFPLSTVTTIGVDYRNKSLQMKGSNVLVRVFDTAGSERYDDIAKAWCSKCDGIMLVLDLTEKRTIHDFRRLINHVREVCPPSMPIMVIGNKIDMIEDQSVFADSIQDLPVDYIETSAKTGANVDACFNQLLHKII